MGDEVTEPASVRTVFVAHMITWYLIGVSIRYIVGYSIFPMAACLGLATSYITKSPLSILVGLSRARFVNLGWIFLYVYSRFARLRERSDHNDVCEFGLVCEWRLSKKHEIILRCVALTLSSELGVFVALYELCRLCKYN